jgi:hypothetical protein
MYISAAMLGTLVIVWSIASALDQAPPLTPCTCCPPKPRPSWTWADHLLCWIEVAAGSLALTYWLGWLG